MATENSALEKKVAELVEKVEHTYYGKYRGVVVDNNDPEKLGRLRLKVPSVLGHDVVTGWAMPCLPYGGAPDQGFFFVPENQAGVWVEFEAGDLEFPIWTGTFWSKPGGKNEVPKPGDTQAPPTRKIIRTLKGSSVEIEDGEDAELVIKYRDGSNENVIKMDDQGIVIEDKDGSKIEMKGTIIKILPNGECHLGNNPVNPVNNLRFCYFTGATHVDPALPGGQSKIIKME